MPNYRRAQTPAGTYFFTVVTYRRQKILTRPESWDILKNVIAEIRQRYPFTVDAWVVLPDHLHFIWSLPAGDWDFSKRWGVNQSRVFKEDEKLISS